MNLKQKTMLNGQQAFLRLDLSILSSLQRYSRGKKDLKVLASKRKGKTKDKIKSCKSENNMKKMQD